MKRANEIVAKNIRDMRNALNLTQKQLADRIGYSVKAISKWENGLGIPPSAVLPHLALALKTDINHLFRGIGDPLYFLGIDGGGTKTDFALADKDGNIINRITLGSSNPVDVGEKELFRVLKEGIHLACGNISLSQVSVHAGIAGSGTGNYPTIVRRFLQEMGFSNTHHGSDVTNAIALGLNDKNGIVVILGTGSVAFTKISDKIIRTGGYGYLFDDKGSGFSIGRDALRTVMEWEDGHGEKTLLTDSVQKKCETATVFESLPSFYVSGKRLLASYAPLVFDAYAQGDKVAARILENNMQAVAQMIINAGNKLPCQRDIPVVFFGGITKQEDIILPLIQKHLDKLSSEETSYHLTICHEPGYKGALLLAGMNGKEDKKDVEN